MGTCTIKFESNGGSWLSGTKTDKSIQFNDPASTGGKYTASFILYDASVLTYANHYLVSWNINYKEGTGGNAEYNPGMKLEIKSSTGGDVTYTATAQWEDVYTIKYLSTPDAAGVFSVRNPEEYHATMGRITLHPPVLKDKSYRFDHWEYNGSPITVLDSSTIGQVVAGTLYIYAICKAISKVALYGRGLKHLESEDVYTYRNSKYLLAASSIDANNSRTLEGILLTDFYESQHRIYVEDIQSSSVKSIDCNGKYTEIYLRVVEGVKEIHLYLYSGDKSNTKFLIHVNSIADFSATYNMYLTFGTSSAYTTLTTTPTFTGITSGSMVVIVNGSDNSMSSMTLSYPTDSLMNYVTKVVDEELYVVKQVYSQSVTFQWDSTNDTDKYGGRYYTTIPLSGLDTQTTYRQCIVSIDYDLLNNLSDVDTKNKVQRFFDFTGVTAGKLDVSNNTLDLVYDYIPNDYSVSLGIDNDISYTNVPIKVVVIV